MNVTLGLHPVEPYLCRQRLFFRGEGRKAASLTLAQRRPSAIIRWGHGEAV